VVRPYGEMGLVRIADTTEDFVAAIEASLSGVDNNWLQSVDNFLAQNSWDLTWQRMSGLIENVVSARRVNVRAARSMAAGGYAGV
jgi:UDP-galactopyranose mutase